MSEYSNMLLMTPKFGSEAHLNGCPCLFLNLIQSIHKCVRVLIRETGMAYVMSLVGIHTH